MRFQNILFATDFSPAAAQAIPYVKQIAKHYGADLCTFHVRPPVVVPISEPTNWSPEVFTEAAQIEDDRHRQEVLDTFRGIRTQVLIEEGSIAPCLQQAIENNHTDLVVIGTHGRTGIGKLLMGSVAEEIFRTVSCPVLTVCPHSDPSYRTPGLFREILYATDLSPESNVAAAHALSLAQEFQSLLTLLHVIPKLDSSDIRMATNTLIVWEKRLRKLVPPEVEAWCNVVFSVAQGDPAEKILEFADLRNADLIVLGVRPEEGVPGAATHLAISTVHKIVSHAHCPVLTVRHKTTSSQ